ncbi:YdcF family protein [Weissella cibaria]|uniref:YdcF family protein n=1 Tax=Weissella cibaria TaxID=137591 RepID=UPI0039839612
MLFVTLIALLLFVLSGYALWRVINADPRSMWLGVWTLFTLFFAAISITMILVQLGGTGIFAFAMIFALFLAIFLFLSVFFDLAVVYYSWQVWRKEHHTLPNLLLPLLFLGLMIFNMIDAMMQHAPAWLAALFIFARVMELYFMLIFVIFLVSAIVYAAVTRKRESDYYVVLGAGLVNGETVGKLLGNRIKAATDAAQRRFDATGVYPTIVFSGGKGGDEKVSEAQAMRDYAVATLNYSADKTLLEDQSRTTRENMRFSRDIISKATGKIDPEFVYFTSEYHVFRAGLQARRFDVLAQGRGGNTPFYYRIPAFIREYIAVLNMHRRLHMAVTGLAFVVAVVMMIATFFVK